MLAELGLVLNGVPEGPNKKTNRREILMRGVYSVLLASMLTAISGPCQAQAKPARAAQAETHTLWDQRNLFAWSVAAYDAKKRGPEQRAEMLRKLGFAGYAYYWIPSDIPAFEAEIQAMKSHGITLQGWWIQSDRDDPLLDRTLALFAKNGVRPHLWFVPPTPYAQVIKEAGGKIPANYLQLAVTERAPYYPIMTRTMHEIYAREWPKTPQEHRLRVAKEAARIRGIAEKAKRYGITVDIYSHIQWIGVPENQADIMDLLKRQGVTNVGLVYNFSHARSTYRDDTKDFARVWKRIQPYVSAVNVAGTHMEDGTARLPGEGDSELAMMRVIQNSGWRGPVGLNAETGGDAEVALTKAKMNLAQLAGQLALKK